MASEGSVQCAGLFAELLGPGFDKCCSLHLPKIISDDLEGCVVTAKAGSRGGSSEGWPAHHLGMLGITPGIGAVIGTLRTGLELWQNKGQKVKSTGSHSCILFSSVLRPLGTWRPSNSLPNGFITRCFLLCARDVILYMSKGKSSFVLRKSSWNLQAW